MSKHIEPDSPARITKPSKVTKASHTPGATRGRGGGRGGRGRGASNASTRGGSNAQAGAGGSAQDDAWSDVEEIPQPPRKTSVPKVNLFKDDTNAATPVASPKLVKSAESPLESDDQAGKDEEKNNQDAEDEDDKDDDEDKDTGHPADDSGEDSDEAVTSRFKLPAFANMELLTDTPINKLAVLLALWIAKSRARTAAANARRAAADARANVLVARQAYLDSLETEEERHAFSVEMREDASKAVRQVEEWKLKHENTQLKRRIERLKKEHAKLTQEKQELGKKARITAVVSAMQALQNQADAAHRLSF